MEQAELRKGLERIARELVDDQPADSIGELMELDPVDVAADADAGDLADLLVDMLCEVVSEEIQERINTAADHAVRDRDLL